MKELIELRFQSRRAERTVAEHRTAESDGPAVILIDEEETLEDV
jgi:hypothetical protein